MISRPLAALLLLLSGCQSEGDAVAGNGGSLSINSENSISAAVKSDVREPLAVPPADPCDDPRNPNFDPDKCVEPDASVARFAGDWEISHVHVATSGVQAFVTDDPAIRGSRFRITAEEIRWTKRASETFTSDDVCTQPSASALPPIVEKEEGGLIVESLAAFSVRSGERGPIHRFGCVGGGHWGPGEAGGSALFIPAGNNRMALQWYDGAILLAERKAP
jgi:hypothetical protein